MHDDFAIDEFDQVPTRSGVSGLDAHARRRPPKENLAFAAPRGSPQPAQPLHAPELTKNPDCVTVEKCAHVPSVSP
jgi:hypothetical protein